MSSQTPVLNLPNGYYELPKGKLANVATFLEMKVLPERVLKSLPSDFQLVKVEPNNLAHYRDWYRQVGEDIMWFSRIIMSDEKLHAQLSHPKVQSFALMKGSEFCGLLELDFKAELECELAFFGLTPRKIGGGLGRAMMDEALRLAFAQKISRLFVHTCTFDHPAALPFYMRSGFTPYAMSVEIHDDPRLQADGNLKAAPQIPLLRAP